jgi:hypothetical protein
VGINLEDIGYTHPFRINIVSLTLKITTYLIIRHYYTALN